MPAYIYIFLRWIWSSLRKVFSQRRCSEFRSSGTRRFVGGWGVRDVSYCSVSLSKETFEDDGTTVFENVGNNLPNNTVSYLRKVDSQSEHEFLFHSLEEFHIFH